MEEGVGVLISNARQGVRRRYHECENRIRKSPTSAVLGAVAAGYFLHRLPVKLFAAFSRAGTVAKVTSFCMPGQTV